MTLTLIAGLSGITFSVLILQLVEKIVHTNNDALSNATFQISFWLAIGASIIIALLGIAAGLGPAFRAMKIKPVDAMREE
jgi:putative ABC transport system permease protein